MRIAWLVNPIFAGWSPLDARLGGSEEGVVEWSERLVKLGHEVTIYSYNCLFFGDLEGVKYEAIDEYEGADVTINNKCPEIEPIGKTFYLTTEVDANKHDLSGFEAVIWPSKWAKDNIPVNTKTVLLPYGYDDIKIYPSPKIPKQVLYASSPDRGLENLLKVWPEVMEAHPDATLIATYGAFYPDSPEGVMFLGEVDAETMNELYKASDIWCHPANGGELYGITGVKAQAAGCIPVYYPVMALTETVKHGIRSAPDTLAKDLIRILGDEPRKEAIRLDLSETTYPTWDSTTKQLLDILQS